MHINIHTKEIKILEKLFQITLEKKNHFQLLHQPVKYIIKRENYRPEKSLKIH